HGEYDSLIPLKEGQKLFQSLTGKNKKLTIIPFADHNNIMLVGFKQYFAVLGSFVR
ncbi:MAG TPA: alpha/beta hydrolase, partial [Desulfotomaculum sp.]|nr:alpha/beta hydrolase [Desulfotomaculum sp.]